MAIHTVGNHIWGGDRGGAPVDPIVMRVFSEWAELGATVEQIESFRELLHEAKIDPTGDEFENLMRACGAYSDACAVEYCCSWEPDFELMTGWQEEVTRIMSA